MKELTHQRELVSSVILKGNSTNTLGRLIRLPCRQPTGTNSKELEITITPQTRTAAPVGAAIPTTTITDLKEIFIIPNRRTATLASGQVPFHCQLRETPIVTLWDPWVTSVWRITRLTVASSIHPGARQRPHSVQPEPPPLRSTSYSHRPMVLITFSTTMIPRRPPSVRRTRTLLRRQTRDPTADHRRATPTSKTIASPRGAKVRPASRGPNRVLPVKTAVVVVSKTRARTIEGDRPTPTPKTVNLMPRWTGPPRQTVMTSSAVRANVDAREYRSLIKVVYI